jgi:proline iminopeptidase
MSEEGRLDVPGGNIWYGIAGRGPGVPLLVLHGGPGFPSDYLWPLGALGDDRPVIFYDQLGCGRSEHPHDPTLWQVARFVEELAILRRALGLDRVHLYGQSWGTMLAVDYLLTRPKGVTSATLASPCLSVPRWKADQSGKVSQLSPANRAVIEQNEAAGTTDSEEYQQALLVFYKKFVCRLDPWPKVLVDSMDNFGLEVYHRMWGPSEFTCNGILRDYDRCGKLKELKLPVLYTCGRHDEAVPDTVAFYRSRTPKAQMAVFEESAHLAHLEEPARYLPLLRGFLEETEKA